VGPVLCCGVSLFVWLVADGWCWLVLREKYCWLVAGDWFILREKYCWLVADKPSEQGVRLGCSNVPAAGLAGLQPSLDVSDINHRVVRTGRRAVSRPISHRCNGPREKWER
jgi:hypothetical protein